MTLTTRSTKHACFLAVLASVASLLPSLGWAQQASRKSAPAPTNALRTAATPARTVGFTPKHVKAASTTVAQPQVEIVEGATYYEDSKSGKLMLSEEPMLKGECDTLEECCLVPCCTLPVGHLEIFAGVNGFTGPGNRNNGTGSFGFDQGLNYGMPLPGFTCLGGQVGFRATQTNLSGAEFTNDARTQGFVTAGLFRRVDVGLQGGVVIDWLTEDWYREADLTNVRGEFSWRFDGCQDFGFWFTSGTKTATETSAFNNGANPVVETWDSNDLYAFFYRRQFGGCGESELRLYAGWSGRSDGLLGLDSLIPLTGSLSLESGFAYLVPNEGPGQGLGAGHMEESWNIFMNLVWYPGRAMGQGGDPYYRPLFRVADNGSFMMDRL